VGEKNKGDKIRSGVRPRKTNSRKKRDTREKKGGRGNGAARLVVGVRTKENLKMRNGAPVGKRKSKWRKTKGEKDHSRPQTEL